MQYISILLIIAGIIYMLLPQKSQNTSKSIAADNDIQETLESGNTIREQLPELEAQAIHTLETLGLDEHSKTKALIALRNIGKYNYDPRVYKKTLLKLIDETPLNAANSDKI